MWELDHKEGWAPKNWCFWTVILDKTLESSLDSREIKPVSPKGNQPWMFIGRTDDEAPILWPPDAKTRLTGKDPDARKDWRQEKGMTKDKMTGWHHQLNGHEFEQAPGDGKDRGAWCAAVHGVTKSWTQLEQLNNNSRRGNRKEREGHSPPPHFSFYYKTVAHSLLWAAPSPPLLVRLTSVLSFFVCFNQHRLP